MEAAPRARSSAASGRPIGKPSKPSKKPVA